MSGSAKRDAAILLVHTADHGFDAFGNPSLKKSCSQALPLHPLKTCGMSDMGGLHVPL